MQRATIYVCATCPSLNCRLEFNNLVQKHASDRGAKGLTSWSQFIAMPLLPSYCPIRNLMFRGNG